MIYNGNDILIVIPTYNAKATIAKVLQNVFRYLPNVEIFVIDDNSPDNTEKIVNNMCSRNSKVHLISRTKKGGRGSAVIEGFKEGLKHKNFNFFIEMDADFAHNPKDLPRIIKKAKEFDVAVASRYLLKSQMLRWKLKRRVISKLANLWIKFVLGIKLTDNTSGFRCYKRKVLKAIDFNLVKSKGFIVLTEIAYQIFKKSFRFGEIPIDFIPVDLNKSNLNTKEVREAFFTVLRLKLNNFKIR